MQAGMQAEYVVDFSGRIDLCIERKGPTWSSGISILCLWKAAKNLQRYFRRSTSRDRKRTHMPMTPSGLQVLSPNVSHFVRVEQFCEF